MIKSIDVLLDAGLIAMEHSRYFDKHGMKWNLNRLTTLANMGRLSVLRGDDLVSEYTRLCDALGALVWEAR